MTNLLYPMIRALYGLRIREPYTLEFGFSGRLGSQFLGQNVWNDGDRAGRRRTPLHPGCDHRRIPYLPVLSREKDHVERRAADLVPALRQTVGRLVLRIGVRTFRSWSASDRFPAGPYYRG